MSGRNLILCILVACVSTRPGVASDDDAWMKTCPKVCHCKWNFDLKWAECLFANISAVPSGLSPEIQALDLSGNPLMTALPANAFSSLGLVKLQQINLISSSISVVDKDALSGLPLLSKLHLAVNQIRVLHRDTFRGTPKLRELWFFHNPIEFLEDGLFANLTSLEMVEMSHSHISRIGVRVFENDPNLRYLGLDSNRLSHMELATVKPLTNLLLLLLDGNPWLCDCHLRPLRDWVFATRVINVLFTPTCAAPPRLKGKRWDRLESSDFVCDPEILLSPAASVNAGDKGRAERHPHARELNTPRPHHFPYNQ